MYEDNTYRILELIDGIVIGKKTRTLWIQL